MKVQENQSIAVSQMLNVWYIYLHLPDKNYPVLEVNRPYIEHLGFDDWNSILSGSKSK